MKNLDEINMQKILRGIEYEYDMLYLLISLCEGSNFYGFPWIKDVEEGRAILIIRRNEDLGLRL